MLVSCWLVNINKTIYLQLVMQIIAGSKAGCFNHSVTPLVRCNTLSNKEFLTWKSFSHDPRIILIRGCVWEVVLGHAKGCLKEGLHSIREYEKCCSHRTIYFASLFWAVARHRRLSIVSDLARWSKSGLRNSSSMQDAVRCSGCISSACHSAKSLAFF